MIAENPDGKWAHYTQRLIRENDPYILKTFLTNAAYEGGFRGYQTAQETAEKYDINVPWLILMDPTSACNTHCTGCWAAEYGHKQSLNFEEMDRVLTEAKALGTHACLFTGGEPLLRISLLWVYPLWTGLLWTGLLRTGRMICGRRSSMRAARWAPMFPPAAEGKCSRRWAGWWGPGGRAMASPSA